LDLIFQSGDGS
jgi:hypothetical protein